MFTQMKKLTFIFQGPYYHGTTDKCIKIVRINFPESPILFSTWTGQLVPTGLADEVIYSQDPGGKINSIWNTSDSTLRQLFSTYNALVKVTTEYCCKIRSDTCLENSRLTELIQYIGTNYRNRLVFLNYLSVSPQRYPLAFHFCDWLVAGRTEQLKKMYYHPDQENLGAIEFLGISFDRHQYGWYCRFRSEQYIIINWIKNLKIKVQVPAYQTEINAEIIASHVDFSRNYVLMIPGQYIGVKNMKRINDLTVNTNDGMFSSNYYDWECREGLKVLGSSVRMVFVHFLYLSLKRIALTPIHVVKFFLHILRYRGARR